MIIKFIFRFLSRSPFFKRIHEVSFLGEKFKSLELDVQSIQNLLMQLTIDGKNTELNGPSVKLKVLKNYLNQVEYYQPIYKVSNVLLERNERISRVSQDRAERIWFDCDQNVIQLSFLDVGCSLGYFSFYLADRGAYVFGIDLNPSNIAVCEAAKKINNVENAHFTLASFDLDYIAEIPLNKFQGVLLLSVLHHVIHARGIEYVKKMMALLISKIPVIYFEGALKDEEVSFAWRETLPEDVLEIFSGIANLRIEQLGVYSTHLSNIKRPLFRVSADDTIVVGDKIYKVEVSKFKAYRDSPLNPTREYFWSKQFLIKKYNLQGGGYARLQHQNLFQIFNEITINKKIHDLLGNNVRFAKLIDYDLTSSSIKLVFERIEGVLLQDVYKNLEIEQKKVILVSVLKSILDLKNIGVYHNDIRLWNIIYTGQDAVLIDFGLASAIELESSEIAISWLVYCFIFNKDFASDYPVTKFPEFDKRDLLPKGLEMLFTDSRITWKNMNDFIHS